MWNYVIAAAFAAVAVYFLAVMVKEFVQERGTVWQRLLAAGRSSATMLWARFMILVSAAVGAVANITQDAGYPEMAEKLKQVVDPNYVLVFTIAAFFVTVLARKRTLDK